MSFRNWLLTGTSLTLMAFAPISAARAQDATDPALVAAYQAYLANQNETTQMALFDACLAAGFPDIDTCIAALTNLTPVESMPADTPPASSEEPAAPPPASEEPAPQPEPPAQEPAPPVEQPAPPAEQPAPPAEQPAPPAEQPAAPAETPPAAEQPSSEEPAAVPPSEEPDPMVELLSQLTAAVNLYNEGVGELASGNAEGQLKIDAARVQIEGICTNAGFTDVDSCLATFGLTLQPLPPAAEPPVSEEPAVSEELPPSADEPVTDEATEVLPEDVPPEEAAPILDSEKDDVNAGVQGELTEAPSEEPTPAEPVAPPANDQAAQEELAPPPAEDQSALTEEGTEAQDQGQFDFGFAEPPAPEDPNVEVVQAPTKDNPVFIFKIGINIYINNYAQERDRYYDRLEDEIYYEDLSRGRVRETIIRPNGVKIVTIYSRYGEVLKRTKVYPDGREFYLATYDRDDDDDGSFYIDPGRDLPPLRLNIPARDYILDADIADEDEVEIFLGQPPVENVRRIYTIDEVKRSARLRDSVRRLEVGGLTFDSGKASIGLDQVTSLSKVAKAMLALLDKNPAEVFLIEGHTDAVGSDVSNLVLSDQRAATVARILTEYYDIPPENLATQGYGERYLKVKTELAEELNRRVTIKRITPLVTYQTASN